MKYHKMYKHILPRTQRKRTPSLNSLLNLLLDFKLKPIKLIIFKTHTLNQNIN